MFGLMAVLVRTLSHMLSELHYPLKYFIFRPWTSFVIVVLWLHSEGYRMLRPHCSFRRSSGRPFVSALLSTSLITFRWPGNFLLSRNPRFHTIILRSLPFVALRDEVVVFGEGFLSLRVTHNLKTTFCSQPATASWISKSWSGVSTFI